MTLAFIKSASLLFFLLNPLFMSIYLLGFFKNLNSRNFSRVLIRGTLISFVTFSLFSYCGDYLFTNVIHARFLSFQIFGGIIFLYIGFKMVFEGDKALNMWREKPAHIAGAIAMPFFIGPGTIMASTMAGASLPPLMAILSIFVALTGTTGSLIILKKVYDHLSVKKELLVQGYINIMGRVMALVVGTFAIEMILKGLESWIKNLN